jgi:superfamily II DNA or RNA helicase
VRDVLNDSLSYEDLEAAFTRAFESGYWDGKRRLLWKNGSYPTGLTRRLTKDLITLGYTPALREVGTLQGNSFDISPEVHFPYPLDPEQEQAVQMILSMRNAPPRRGIISSPPRSGKTITAAAAIREINEWPVLFLCERLDIAQPPRGAVAKFIEYFGPSFKVGHAYDGEFVGGNIVVATVQTAMSALDRPYSLSRDEFQEDELSSESKLDLIQLIQSAPVIVVDEAHHAAAQSYLDVLSNTHQSWTIALSGTPWRDDNLDLVMEGAVGPIIHETSYEQMIDRGRLVPADIYLVHMPPKRYFKGVSFSTRRKDYIFQNPARNRAIAQFCRNMVESGRSVMVVVDQTSHLKCVHGWLNSFKVPHVPMAASGEFRILPRNRKDVWMRLHRKQDLCLVTTLGQEGVDVPSLDSVVVAAGGKSSVRCMQRFRAMTAWPGKENCYILDFVDEARYFKDHSQERVAMYDTQPEKVFRVHHITGYTKGTHSEGEVERWVKNQDVVTSQ